MEHNHNFRNLVSNDNNAVNDNNRDATAGVPTIPYTINTVDTSGIEAAANQSPEEFDFFSADNEREQMELDALKELFDQVKGIPEPATVTNPKRFAMICSYAKRIEQILEAEMTEFNVGLRSSAGSTHCKIVVTIYATVSLSKKNAKEFASIVSQADHFSIDASSIKDTFVVGLDFDDVFIRT